MSKRVFFVALLIFVLSAQNIWPAVTEPNTEEWQLGVNYDPKNAAYLKYASNMRHVFRMLLNIKLLVSSDVQKLIDILSNDLTSILNKNSLPENYAKKTKNIYLFTRSANIALFKISILEESDYKWTDPLRKGWHKNDFWKNGLNAADSLALRSDVIKTIYDSFFNPGLISKYIKSQQITSDSAISKTIMKSSIFVHKLKRSWGARLKESVLWTTDQKWYLRMMWTEKPYNQMCIDYFIQIMALYSYLYSYLTPIFTQESQQEKVKPAFKLETLDRIKNLRFLLDELNVYLRRNFVLNYDAIDDTTTCVQELLEFKLKKIDSWLTGAIKRGIALRAEILRAASLEKKAESEIRVAEASKQASSEGVVRTTSSSVHGRGITLESERRTKFKQAGGRRKERKSVKPRKRSAVEEEEEDVEEEVE